MKLSISKSLFLVLSLIILSSCQHKSKKNKDNVIEESQNILYQKGISELEESQYKAGAEYFSNAYFADPSSKLASKSQLLEIYAFFMAQKYEDSIEASENFLKFHPLDTNADYALYMNALCNYVQLNPLYLDQGLTEKTKILFTHFLKNYPYSKFVPFVKNKLIIVDEHLSGKEISIGRYYLLLNDPISAIPRFQTVLNKYPKTNQIPEALYRLSISFKMLGLENESIRYASILGHNFPDSKWYKYIYDVINAEKDISEDKKIDIEIKN